MVYCIYDIPFDQLEPIVVDLKSILKHSHPNIFSTSTVWPYGDLKSIAETFQLVDGEEQLIVSVCTDDINKLEQFTVRIWDNSNTIATTVLFVCHSSIFGKPGVTLQGSQVHITFTTIDLTVISLSIPVHLADKSQILNQVINVWSLEDLPKEAPTSSFVVEKNSLVVVLSSGRVCSLNLSTEEGIRRGSIALRTYVISPYRSDASVIWTLPQNLFGKSVKEPVACRLFDIGTRPILITSTQRYLKFWCTRSKWCLKSVVINERPILGDELFCPVLDIYDVCKGDDSSLESRFSLCLVVKRELEFVIMVYNVRIEGSGQTEVTMLTELPISSFALDPSNSVSVGLLCLPMDNESRNVLLFSMWKRKDDGASLILNSSLDYNSMNWVPMISNQEVDAVSFCKVGKMLLTNNLSGYSLITKASQINFIQSHVSGVLDARMLFLAENSGVELSGLLKKGFVLDALKYLFIFSSFKIEAIYGFVWSIVSNGDDISLIHIQSLLKQFSYDSRLVELCSKVVYDDISELLKMNEAIYPYANDQPEICYAFAPTISRGLLHNFARTVVDVYVNALILIAYMIEFGKDYLEKMRGLKLFRSLCNDIVRISQFTHTEPLTSLKFESPEIIAKSLVYYLSTTSTNSVVLWMMRNPNECELVINNFPKRGKFAFMWGQYYLKINEERKAEKMFLAFGNYIKSTEDKDFLNSASDVIGNNVSEYFARVAEIFASCSVYVISLNFALKSRGFDSDSEWTAELRIFSYAMELNRFDTAYNSLIRLSTKEFQRHIMVNHFVSAVADVEISALIHRYPFVGYEYEYVQTLKQKTLSSIVFNKLLYTYFYQRNDYQEAATWLYAYSRNKELPLREKAKSLVGTINCLRLLDMKDRWITWDGDLLAVDMIFKEYLLVVTELEITIYMPSLNVSGLTVKDIVCLCLKNDNLLERAIMLAENYGIDLNILKDRLIL